MLSNKLLLVTAGGSSSTKSWAGDVLCQISQMGQNDITFFYGSWFSPWLSGGFGMLAPPLESEKADTQIAGISITVDANTMLMSQCYIWFDSYAISSGHGIEFEGLNKITIHSTTGGEPFTISDVQSCWDSTELAYNLFSADLANWGYTNLTAETFLEFTLELEWA